MAGTKKNPDKEYSSNWGGARAGAGNKTGGARAGAGRPKGSIKQGEKRTRNIGIRVTESELVLLKEKAASAGLGLTDFIIQCVKNA